MDKDKKMFIGIILLMLAFMVYIGIITFQDKKEEITGSTDAILFKNEYESLNNVVRDKDGKTIKEISIANDNPVDILTEEETISLLENGTGIIYLGFPDCPWCRSMLPILLRTLNNVNIDKLYYLNIGSIRDTLVLDENNKVEVKEEGTPGYSKILELMDEVLEPYYLTTSDGKKIDTKEKRLYAPTVVAVKEGKIVEIHVGTVDGQKDPYEDLTQEQQEELSDTFMKLIRNVYNIDCDEAC